MTSLLAALFVILADTLPNVVVTGTRQQSDLRHMPMTVTTVDHATLTQNQQQNVLPTLTQQVPGLFVTSRGVLGYGVSDGAAGTITLRGVSSASGGLMVLIDGMPQYQGLFGHSTADLYQTMLAERVEVLRGPASMLYGSNAMGGVLNIVTRQMLRDGVRTDINLGAGSYGTVQADATSRLRKGRLWGVVSLQGSRTDNHRPHMGFYQYGGQVKLGYDISPQWQVSAHANLTHHAASYPGSTDSPLLEARQWINRGSATATLSNSHRRATGALSVYHNFGRHKINDGYDDDGLSTPADYYFRSTDALTGLSAYESLSLWPEGRLTLGLDYQHIHGHAWNTSRQTGEETSAIGDEDEDEVAAYVAVRQNLVQRLTLDAGLRLDHHSQTGTEWVPQGGVVYRPTSATSLKAMVSKGFRNPSLREMYLWVPANDELEPERLVTYELSWRHSLPSARLTYGLNVFHIDGDNIIQTQMVDGRRRNVNTGEIENSGVEAELSWQATSHWLLQTNYSYLHMKKKVVAAPEHKLFLGADGRYGKWTMNAGLQYVHNLYTSVSPEEKEDFWLLNATLGYQVCPPLRLWLKGDNLLAQRYEINAGYPMPKATFMAGVSLTL